MKIIKKFIRNGEGRITVIPEEEEDFWHIYNLISTEDIVRAMALRKVVLTNKIGTKTTMKRKIMLTLKIETINYYAGDNLELSLKGRNVHENEYLKMGQYHTFNLDLNYPITIMKKNWDFIHFKIIREISNPTNGFDLAAFVLDEGVAHLCYVKASMTLQRAKIERHIPKKKSGSEQHDKALAKFFETCLETILTIDFDIIKCLVLGSPGYVKDEFLTFIDQQMFKPDIAAFNKRTAFLSKIVKVKTSSGFTTSLPEILADPTIVVQLKDTKAIQEVQALEQFYIAMNKDPDTVCYGDKHVFTAFEAKAISVLLISDSLFRTRELTNRKRFAQLVERLKNRDIDVHIFSSQHSSGQKLNNLTGIAAILKFPMELDGDEEDDKNLIVEDFKTRIEDRKEVASKPIELGENEIEDIEKQLQEIKNVDGADEELDDLDDDNDFGFDGL